MSELHRHKLYVEGQPCEVCQRQDAPRISVHAECIIHSHETSTSDAVPRKQEEWATLHMQLTEAVEARSRREARLTAENATLRARIEELEKEQKDLLGPPGYAGY